MSPSQIYTLLLRTETKTSRLRYHLQYNFFSSPSSHTDSCGHPRGLMVRAKVSVSVGFLWSLVISSRQWGNHHQKEQQQPTSSSSSLHFSLLSLSFLFLSVSLFSWPPSSVIVVDDCLQFVAARRLAAGDCITASTNATGQQQQQ